jgi:hypothetical protein
MDGRSVECWEMGKVGLKVGHRILLDGEARSMKHDGSIGRPVVATDDPQYLGSEPRGTATAN